MTAQITSRTMGFPVIVPPEIERQAFHLAVNIPPEADGFADMLMEVFPELAVEVVHRK
jgi:hypothetical protein